MADLTFNTTSGQTVDRELMILYLNTGSASAPTWSAIGKRVEDSSAEYDWGEESAQDILGNVHSSMKKPVITQSFEPYKLDSADSALLKIWNLAIKDQDVSALTSMDVLCVHFYAGAVDAPFAERYNGSMIKPTSIGGEGGGAMEMPFEVTFGGVRTIGTASVSQGVVTFNPASGATS